MSRTARSAHSGAALRALRTSGVCMGTLLDHHGRYRVFENELFLITGFENQGVLIEALDPSGEFDAAHQIDREHHFLFASIIQKTILNILRRFFHSEPLKALSGKNYTVVTALVLYTGFSECR